VRIDFCEVKNGTEVIFINPLRVCYFSSLSGGAMTRIFFEGAKPLDINATPEDVKKMLTIADGLHLTPVTAM
jgi:hypothetical protein